MIDYKRLFGGLLILLLVQLLGDEFVLPLIWSLIPGYPGAIIYFAVVDYSCSLLLNLFYIPAGYRKNAMKNPEFHRVVLTYFMVFFIFSIITMFI